MKIKKSQLVCEWLSRIFPSATFFFKNALKSENFCLRQKSLDFFYKFNLNVISTPVSDRFILDKRIKNGTFGKVSNIAIFTISVAVNINFSHVEEF